jgi:hypothetical protein
MSILMKSLASVTQAGLVALLALTLPILVQAEPEKTAETNGRAMAVDIEAEVTAIDLKTREVTLRGPNGFETTLVAPEKVIKLEDVSVGDRVVGTFFAALEGEVRTPTAEELAEPWMVMQGKSLSGDAANPGIDTARVIRAVVTIEALNPETGVVVVKDSRGKEHSIGDVEAAKMAGVKVGQTAVVVFTEAMALTLQKEAKPAQ